MPITGTIPPSYLQEVSRINPEQKGQLNEFLRMVGISTNTVYNDLEGYIRYEQDHISPEALVHMMVRWLSKGEYGRVFAASESLIRNENPINESTGYYFRGLYQAFQGKLNQAYKDMDTFVKISGTTPKYVEKNMEIVKNTLKSNRGRDFTKKQRNQLKNLKTKLCMDVDEKLWSVSFTGYTYRER